jgi:hypothetical protein
MRGPARHRKGFDFNGALCRAGVVAAALYLALVQMLSAAHAVSGEANAPNHHNSACVLCVAAHGNSHGLIPGAIEAPAAPISFIALSPIVRHTLAPARVRAPAPRGPPSF